MKFEASVKDLLPFVQEAAQISIRNAPVYSMQNLRITAAENRLLLEATNNSLGFNAITQCTSYVDGALVLNTQKFYDILRHLHKEAEVKIKVDNGRAHITSNSSRFSLAVFNPDEYPDQQFNIKDKDAIHVNTAELNRAVQICKTAISHDDTRAYLTGLFCHSQNGNLTFAGTDGHRLCKVETEIKANDVNAIIPRAVFDLISKIKEDHFQLYIKETRIIIKTTNTEYAGKLIDGTFPDYERVIPKDNDKEITVSVMQLKSAIGRTSVLASDKELAVDLDMKDAQLKVLSHNADQESAEEEIQAIGDDIQLRFNYKYLLAALDTCKADDIQISFNNSTQPVVIQELGENNNAVRVLMPMRA